jgi:hypothetical protein
MSMTPNLDVANSARAAARIIRARHLLEIAGSTTSVHETLAAATTDAGRPLLRLTLRQLLMAQPGWGEHRAAAVLRKVLQVSGATSIATRKLTVSWVLDSRAGGRRFMALCDAITAKDSAPWPGFPFAPRPARATTETAQ